MHNALPPLLNMAAPASDIHRALVPACVDWGLFQVTGHGIPADLLQSALGVSRRFFGQALDDKQAVSRGREQPWGYYDRELTKNLRDRKEIFDLGHVGSVPWPAAVQGFQSVTREFSAAAHALAVRLSLLIAQALDLPLQPLLSLRDDHTSFARLNHYPVEDILAHHPAPPAGPLGISHHTDAGVITVLLQDAVNGLQMLHQGEWIDVPARPDTLTINLGDMFQVWANDRVRAPVHRVLASNRAERYSIAYFLNPGAESVIAPLQQPGRKEAPRYRAISWEEFRGLRALGDYGDFGEEVQISHYRCEG